MKYLVALSLFSVLLFTGCWGDGKVAATDAGDKAASDAEKTVEKLQQQIDTIQKAHKFDGVALASEFDTKVSTIGSPINGDQVEKGTALGLPNGWVMFKTVSGRWYVVEFTPTKTGDVFGRLIEFESGR